MGGHEEGQGGNIQCNHKWIMSLSQGDALEMAGKVLEGIDRSSILYSKTSYRGLGRYHRIKCKGKGTRG